MIPTNTLANRYLYEIENKIVNVHQCILNEYGDIVVTNVEDDYYSFTRLYYFCF